jgi:uncharacterized linocin/CFP29 family protein
MMNDLYRELAPVTAEAWTEIEKEARSALKATLAGRRLVDFQGPLGWHASSVDLGRTEEIDAPASGASARLRRVQPLFASITRGSLNRSSACPGDGGDSRRQPPAHTTGFG